MTTKTLIEENAYCSVFFLTYKSSTFNGCQCRKSCTCIEEALIIERSCFTVKKLHGSRKTTQCEKLKDVIKIMGIIENDYNKYHRK